MTGLPLISPDVILVVDDEPFVLQVVTAILARAGYEILQAASPSEALDIAEVRRDPIHLFLCDVVLPDLSGPALAERLCRLHPNARCLFMAGLRDHPEIGVAVARGHAFLPKPFVAGELVRKVREVLAAPRQSCHV